MNERGQYGNAKRRGITASRGDRVRGTTVGLTLFHGGSDRDSAGQQIDTYVQAIKNAVLTAAGADPALVTSRGDTLEKLRATPNYLDKVLASRDAIEKSPYRALWDGAVSPLFNEWNSFYSNKQHWYDYFTQIFTSWEDYDRWLNRVQDLRAKVENAGIKVMLPPMHALSKSLLEQIESGAGDIWKVVKYGIYGVLAIGGVVALSSVASNLRRGKDPAEPYTRMLSRRPRAARREEARDPLPRATAYKELPPGAATELEEIG